ncbi:hypothetical protein GOV06_03825 [Candidatus Woesearchaeota archaeon]|nr:hypothetical protein [Candidatus Woesearchaeota archaeon]
METFTSTWFIAADAAKEDAYKASRILLGHLVEVDKLLSDSNSIKDKIETYKKETNRIRVGLEGGAVSLNKVPALSGAMIKQIQSLKKSLQDMQDKLEKK